MIWRGRKAWRSAVKASTRCAGALEHVRTNTPQVMRSLLTVAGIFRMHRFRMHREIAHAGGTHPTV